MADLLGIAGIIGASATFVGTTGTIWLQATGRGERRNGDRDSDDDRDPISDLSDDELDEEMRRREERRERDRRRREERRQHITAAIPGFLRRRIKPVRAT